MGNSAKVVLLYGVVLREGAVEPFVEGEVDEETGAWVVDRGPEEGPAWLVYMGDADETGVTVVATGHHGAPVHIVAIASSERIGDDWTPLAVVLPALPEDADARIDAYLRRWKLTGQVDRKSSPSPRWLAAPRYD